LAADLYAACDLLEREKSLREALSDAGRSERTRAEIAEQLFASRIGALASEVLAVAVRQRWSSAQDLVTGIRVLADRAALTVAADNGTLDSTEDQIFRIGRIVSGSATLQAALTDPAISTSAKNGIIADLLTGKVTDTTALVVGFALSHLEGRRVEQAIDELVDLAAEQRQRVVAVVKVARPLDAELSERMAAALGQLTGRTVSLNVVVDPTVLGGAHVTIAGEVIDGTVATRLEQAQRLIAG
jgi:F-type H+-transporting ATPase subunit delta